MEILSLGEKIKRKRKELKMTLKDLAKDRITPGQISLVESGRSNPSMDLLEYLASSLNTTVEYLMESEESQAEKICTYYEQLAESYIISGKYEKGEAYIDEALKYTEKYNLEYKKARCYFLRAEINMNKEEFATAQQLLMSANVIFIKNNKYEEIIKSFLNLAKITLKLKAYHSASSYLKQADKVYTDNNIGNDFLLGEIYYNMAKVLFTIEQTEEARKYTNLARNKFNEIQNKEQYASSLISLSDEYNKKDDSVNAIKYSTKALEVYKEIEKSSTISSIENTLGKLFYNFNEIDEAFKHFELSKEIRVRNNDSELVDTLINLCKNYIKIKDLPKCKETLEELDLRLDRNNIKSIIEVNLLKHRILTIEEKTEEAKDILVSTYNMAKEFNLNEEASNLAIAIAKFYLDKKEDDLAKKYLDEGVEIFKKMGKLQNYIVRGNVMEILSTGEKIKRSRIYKGITLKELCGDKISISKMSCIENGKVKADKEIIQYIANKIGVDFKYLVQDVYEQIEDNIENIKNNIRKKDDDFEESIEYNLSYANHYEYYDLSFKLIHILFEYYLNDKKYEKIQLIISQYYDLYQKTNTEENTIVYFRDMAQYLFQNNEYLEAITYYNKLREILKINGIKDKSSYSNIAYDEAICYCKLFKEEEAYNLLQEAVMYANSVEDKLQRGKIYHQYALSCIVLGKTEVEEYIEKAYECNEENDVLVALSKGDYGEAYFKANEKIIGTNEIMEGIAIFPKENKEEYVKFLNRCIKIFLDNFESNKAYELVDEALNMAIETNKIELIERAYYLKGIILQQEGNYRGAELYMNLSLDSLLKYGSKEERRKRYMEMGNMYYNLDEFKESIKYFSLAMEKDNSI